MNNHFLILNHIDLSHPFELLQTPKSKDYFNVDNYYEYFEDEKNNFEHKMYYSVESIYKNELINSTPTMPTQLSHSKAPGSNAKNY